MAEIPARLLGRDFGADALREVRRLVLDCLPRTRTEIARQLCRRLGWVGPGGQPAVMSARVALLRLHRTGWIELPPPRTLGGNARRLPPPVPVLRSEPVEGSLDQAPPVILRPVQDPHQSKLWNGLIAHYHYLGHSTLPGAQIRFLVYLGDQPAGAVGFGASAWQISARDRFIGWTGQQRQARLHLILNNARFLILGRMAT